MKQIWKYPLPTDDGTILEMPEGAEVLTVQTQAGLPCLWALVDPFSSRTERSFRVYGTGHPLADDPGAYVGTYQQHGGRLVWHLFELAEVPEVGTPVVVVQQGLLTPGSSQ